MSRANSISITINEAIPLGWWTKRKMFKIVSKYVDQSKHAKKAIDLLGGQYGGSRVSLEVYEDDIKVIISIKSSKEINHNFKKITGFPKKVKSELEDLGKEIEDFFHQHYRADLKNEEYGYNLKTNKLDLIQNYFPLKTIKNPGRLAFHITKPRNLRNILKNGIIPSKDEIKISVSSNYRTQDRIFLFKENAPPKVMFFYAQYVLDIKNPAFLKIDLSKLPKNTIYFEDETQKPYEVNAMFIEGVSIPPNAIEPIDIKFKRILNDKEVWAELEKNMKEPNEE